MDLVVKHIRAFVVYKHLSMIDKYSLVFYTY